MNAPKEKVWNNLFKILCILGCGYQLQGVVKSYFSYGTVTKNRYFRPYSVSNPKIHLCFLYLADVIDWNPITKKYGNKSHGYDMHGANPKLRKWMDYVTIKEIFDNTPQLKILSCATRDETGHDVIESKDCKVFNITKYVQQQYICYMIKTEMKNPIPFKSITESLLFDHLVLQFNYGGNLSMVHKLRVTLSDRDIPYTDSYYSLTFYKKSDEISSTSVSCQRFENIFLGYPYDRKPCPTDGDTYKYRKCVDICIIDKIFKYYNRLPAQTYNFKPEDLLMISDSMMKNKTLRYQYSSILDTCDTLCNVMVCQYSYCITSGQMKATKLKQDEEHVSNFKVLSSSYPNIYVIYVASLPFLDFIIYVFSSLGTWFGLVIISLNPIYLFKISRDKISRYIASKKNQRANRRDIYLRRMMMRSNFYVKYYIERQKLR